jgi:hypothetical protein
MIAAGPKLKGSLRASVAALYQEADVDHGSSELLQLQTLGSQHIAIHSIISSARQSERGGLAVPESRWIDDFFRRTSSVPDSVSG